MTTKAAIELHKITGKKLTLGNFLWSARLCEGESLSKFAKKLGVSSQYLCDLEHGRKTVSPKKAKHFAEKLGYLPEQLVELAVQDILDHDGIKMKVHMEAIA
jgi:transcriptional regulator with XRE-family HTH domain